MDAPANVWQRCTPEPRCPLSRMCPPLRPTYCKSHKHQVPTNRSNRYLLTKRLETSAECNTRRIHVYPFGVRSAEILRRSGKCGPSLLTTPRRHDFRGCSGPSPAIPRHSCAETGLGNEACVFSLLAKWLLSPSLPCSLYLRTGTRTAYE